MAENVDDVVERDDDGADDGATDEELIEQAQELFELARERERDNRDLADEDLRFVRLREQWADKDKKQREEEGRPCLTLDKLGAAVRQVVNDGRQNRPAIKVHPVGSGADAETAEVFNGLIRNIEVISDADTAYDTSLDFAVSSGLGYLKVNTRYCSDDSFERDIVIERVPDPKRIYGDPHSLAADSSDWNNAFEIELMTSKAFEKEYPDADPIDWEVGPYEGVAQCWRENDDVVVLTWWHREEVQRTIYLMSDGSVVDDDILAERKDEFAQAEPPIEPVGKPRQVASHKVVRRVLTGAEILEEQPWPGRYIPISPVYGDDVIVEGKRHLSSLIRPAIDAQRMYNVARSTETEVVGLTPKTPFIGKKGTFKSDADKWETANTENHAFIEYDGVEAPERQPYAGPPAGWMALAAAAADDIKASLGMFDASAGQGAANEQSGKAILGLQARSDTSTFHYVDNQSRGIRQVGRIVIDLIPSTYSTARVLRVITGEGDHTQVPVNQPVPVMGPDGKPQPQLNAAGQPVLDPISGLPIMATKIYDLTAGKYDLTVQAGPGFATRRQEAAAQMVEVMTAYPPSAPVIAPRLAKMLDWPGAEELGDELQQVAAQQASANGPQGEQAAMMAKVQAEGQQRQAQLQQEGQLRQQQMALDHQANLAKAAQDAAIERTKAASQMQLQREAAAHDAQLQRERMEADIGIQTRKAELEAGLQRQRFALEASMKQTPDPVVPGGDVG